jgi:hypothetical protein
MQYTWLEKMASSGQIRPEAKQRIYEDCSQFLKMAEGFKMPTPDQLAKGIAEFAGAVGLTMLAEHGIGRLVDRHKMKKTIEDIRSTRASLLADPAFHDYKEKADARFSELVKVAPTLAADPKRSKDLVAKSLHTGFSNEDMNHLAVMQATYTAKDPYYTSKVNSSMQKKASAEKVGEMYADVLFLVKEAGLFDGAASAAGKIRGSTVGQILRNVALVSSIPLLAGVGQGIASEYLASRDSKIMAKKLRTSFDEAMRRSQQDDPNRTGGISLHDDPEGARRAFQTLVHFAPHVALHPDSARSFMTRVLSQGHFIDTPDVKQLTEIERNLSDAGKRSPFFEGFSSAAGAMGLGEGIRSTIKDTTEPLREQNRRAMYQDLGVKQAQKGSSHG